MEQDEIKNIYNAAKDAKQELTCCELQINVMTKEEFIKALRKAKNSIQYVIEHLESE
jgi:hypothetical protein